MTVHYKTRIGTLNRGDALRSFKRALHEAQHYQRYHLLPRALLAINECLLMTWIHLSQMNNLLDQLESYVNEFEKERRTNYIFTSGPVANGTKQVLPRSHGRRRRWLGVVSQVKEPAGKLDTMARRSRRFAADRPEEGISGE